MKMKIILGVAVTFLFFIFLAGNASALDVTTDSCYTFVDNNTYVTLNASLSWSGSCFYCNGFENLTLDCAGYTVTGSGSQPFFFRSPACDNITIKNCTVVNAYYWLWSSGTDYPTRNYHIYNVNATKYTTDGGGAFLYVSTNGGVVINIDSHNVTYYDAGAEYMYYIEGASGVNAYQYNVTQTGGGGGNRWRITGGTRTYYAEDYAWMNITALNATSGDAIAGADVNITDNAGIKNVNTTTDADGSLYDYLLFQYYNITTSSGIGGSETSTNPQSISGRKNTYVNSTTFDAVDNGNFLLYLEEPVPDVTAPNIIIESPHGKYYIPEIYFNVTMNDTHPDTCLVDWGQGNYTMTNSSGDWNYFNDSMPEGSFIVEFFCNDTSGNIGYNTTNFAIDLPPVIFIDDCMNLPRSDTIYKFQNNISTSVVGTCFHAGTITNATMDCDGFTILDTTSGGTEPVLIGLESVNDFTLKNCNIINFSHVFLNGGSTPVIYAYDINIQTSNHDTPDFLENIASARNYTIYLINVTHIGTGAGSFLFQNDNANMTIYAINSSWSNVNPMYRKYAGSADAYFAIYKMFNTGFRILQMDTGNPIFNATVDISDVYGNPFTIFTDTNGNANILLNYYNCSTHETGDNNFNCGEDYYNPYIINVLKSGYATNTSSFNVTDNSIVIIYMTDSNSPVISIDVPVNSTHSNSSIWFNITGNRLLDACFVDYGYGNKTMTNSSGNWNYLNSSMADGNYLAEFFCNSTVGVIGYNSVNFAIDTTPPLIDVTSPLNVTYTVPSMWFNITSPDAVSCLVNYGLGGEIMTNSSGNWSYLNGSMINGVYSVQFYCVDAFGNLNVTTPIVFTVDVPHSKPPIIDPSSITGQLVLTLGFGIMGLFAILTLLGIGYVTSTGKPDPETIAKIMIGVTIIILMIVAVWTGIVTPP
jgi:hypothetical protein